MELLPGTRVRMKYPHWLIRFRSRKGTIVREDTYGDYYIVRLDKPAIDKRTGEDLQEVVVMDENMEVLQSETM